MLVLNPGIAGENSVCGVRTAELVCVKRRRAESKHNVKRAQQQITKKVELVYTSYHVFPFCAALGNTLIPSV